MKIKGLLITGIIFVILGIGLTATASTQINFKEEFDGVFIDPTLEEKQKTFGEIKKITYQGDADNINIVYSEDENSFTYYENKNLTYDIQYDEASEELNIKEYHQNSFFNYTFAKRKSILKIHSALQNLDLDVDAGNVKVEGLTIEKVTLEVNAGNLDLTDLKIGEAMVSEDAGNMNIKNTVIKKLTADVSAGNMTFEGDILETADITMSAGNLKLTLSRTSNEYTINGKGNGTTKINYDVTAGNKNIYFAD